MTAKEIEQIGLYQHPKQPHIFSDIEDIWFNSKTKELFYHSCIDGTLTLYRKVKDLEDLKQALWDGFPYDRNRLNLE